jgi:predicted acylesterase/phospholipase RssA/ABC-type phosphate/phosphonate transport system substrate-binding protein
MLLLVPPIVLVHSTAGAQEEKDLDTRAPYRIGIVDYDGSTKARSIEIRDSFNRLKKRQRVTFASGTAEEVLDWITEGSVDIAVLSPGAFAATTAFLTPQEPGKPMSSEASGNRPSWHCRYLVTHSLLRSSSPFASQVRKKPGGFLYEALCLMHREAFHDLKVRYGDKSDQDIIKAAYLDDSLQFVFGDPLSLSSHIVPRAQLCELMEIDANGCSEFSFGLSETVRMLIDEPVVVANGQVRYRVGFVFDGTTSYPETNETPVDQRRMDANALAAPSPSVKPIDETLVAIRLPPPTEPDELKEATRVLEQRTFAAARAPEPNRSINLPAEVWVTRSDFPEAEAEKLREEFLRLVDTTEVDRLRKDLLKLNNKSEIDRLLAALPTIDDDAQNRQLRTDFAKLASDDRITGLQAAFRNLNTEAELAPLTEALRTLNNNGDVDNLEAELLKLNNSRELSGLLEDISKLKNHSEIQRIADELLQLNDSAHDLFRDQGKPTIQTDQREFSELELLVGRVRAWARNAGVMLESKRQSSLAEIWGSMRHSERRDRRKPRLALVLSGGGAKCAYQAGAIESIEQDLARLRYYVPWNPFRGDPPPDKKPQLAPDINLVVGTSGGALNAVPIAMELTKIQNSGLATVWESIDLETLGQPYRTVRLLLGVVLGSVLIFLTWLAGEALKWCFSVVVWIRRAFYTKRNRNAKARFGLAKAWITAWIRLPSILRIIVILISGGLLVCQEVRPDIVSHIVPKSVPNYYGWVLLDLSLAWAAVVVFVGLALREFKRFHRLKAPFELSCWRGLSGVTVAVLALLAIVVFDFYSLVGAEPRNSLFRGEPMEELIVSRFEELLRLRKKGESPTGTMEARKRAVSDIVRKGIKRDLVITGSRLGMKPPSDLYFYLPAPKSAAKPRYEMQGRELAGDGNLYHWMFILDYVIASGTIFPFFPPHSVAGMETFSKGLSLVDGGFAHNTPVEAAERWDATHIIVIEASPELHNSSARSFGGNVLAAYYHLFAQAQLTDVRSREGLEIYTLRPQVGLLGTLDFAKPFTHDAVVQGRNDAQEGRFRQYSRPPQFHKESKAKLDR